MFDLQEYKEARSLKEALELLEEVPERLPIAGGTDILVKLRQGQIREARLVGLHRLEELKIIEVDPHGTLSIGAMVTFRDLAQNNLIRRHVPILVEAALTLGGPQIRNVATLGGNLCNGATSADSAPTLLALNARLRLLSLRGERLLPIETFYRGPGEVDVQPGEILTHILLDPRDFSGFKGKMIKFSPRKAMDIATLGLAVMCQLTEARIISDLRIALGVAGPTPLRCRDAEVLGMGKEALGETIEQIARAVVGSMSARTSWRGSKEYREHLAVELTRRALREILLGTGGDTHV